MTACRGVLRAVISVFRGIYQQTCARLVNLIHHLAHRTRHLPYRSCVFVRVLSPQGARACYVIDSMG